MLADDADSQASKTSGHLADPTHIALCEKFISKFISNFTHACTT